MVDKIEEQYLEKVLEIATKNLEQIEERSERTLPTCPA